MNFLTLLILVFLPIYAIAEVCPSTQEIKQGNLQYWQALDLENASPLSLADFKRFQTRVKKFSLAEWMEDAPEGNAHCYYQGASNDTLYLNTYLVKRKITPNMTSLAWHKVSLGIFQCLQSRLECSYLTE